MDNIEIEIKIQVKEHMFLDCEAHLKKNAIFIEESKQTDIYFTPAHKNFLEPKYPFEWLSIRERNSEVTLNYKHWHPENSPTSTHCDEHEVIVSDANALKNIFHAIGIENLVTVKKKRKIFTLYNDFEIALDTVADLGFFIEIEYIGSSLSIKDANKKLLDVAKVLRLDISKKDNRGYPYLLLERMSLIENSAT